MLCGILEYWHLHFVVGYAGGQRVKAVDITHQILLPSGCAFHPCTCHPRMQGGGEFKRLCDCALCALFKVLL